MGLFFLHRGCSVSVQALAHFCIAFYYTLETHLSFTVSWLCGRVLFVGLISVCLLYKFTQAMSPPQPGHLFSFDWIISNKQNTLVLLVS